MKKISLKLFAMLVAQSAAMLNAFLDTKHTAENRSLATAVAASVSTATAAALKNPAIDVKKEVEKSLSQKHSKLVRPIPPCYGSPVEKIDAFTRAAIARDTQELYYMAHDPDIKKHLKDDNNEQEAINRLVDSQGKTVLEHAIENNDVLFAKQYAQKQYAQMLPGTEQQKMIRYALQAQRPRVFRALVPRKPNESDEKALKQYIFTVQNLTMLEYTVYQDALAIAQQKHVQRFHEIYQTVSHHMQDSQNFDPKVAMIIAQKLHPTIEEQTQEKGKPTMLVSLMHPELETAIVAGDIQKFDTLAAAGWLTDAHNKNGHDALALAMHHAQSDIVKKIVDQISFVPEQRRNELKKSAEEHAKYHEKLTDHDPQAKELHKKHTEIAQLIDTAWPNQAKDAALIKALDENNTGTFAEALANGANPNARDANECVIAFKALNKDPVFLRMLLDTKKLEERVGPQSTAHPLLSWAINHDKAEHAKLLLNAGFDPNVIMHYFDNNPYPILIWAIVHNKLEYVKLLLERGANPNVTITDYGKQYPLLYWTIKENKPEYAKLLLERGANPNVTVTITDDKKLYPILYWAIQNNKLEYVKLLLERGANPNVTIITDYDKPYPILYWIMRENKLEYVKLLLERGADPNVIITDDNNRSCSLLYWAMRENKSEYVKLLLERGANPNAIVLYSDNKQYPLLYWAIKEDKPEYAKLLLERGADPNALDVDGKPIARTAFYHKNPYYLAILIANKTFNPNTTVELCHDNIQYPILHWCIQKNMYENVKLLLERGANPNALDGRGAPALIKVISDDKLEYFKLLLEKGADPNVRTQSPFDQPAIAYAIHHKDLTYLKILLEKGANLETMIPVTDSLRLALYEYAKHYHTLSTPSHLKLLEEALAKKTRQTKQAEEEYIYSCA